MEQYIRKMNGSAQSHRRWGQVDEDIDKITNRMSYKSRNINLSQGVPNICFRAYKSFLPES